MKKFYTCLIAVFAVLSASAQNYCDNPGYFVTPSNAQSILDQTIVFDTATDYYGVEFPLKLRIAVPVGDTLPFVKRPFILAVHGGGFLSDSLSGSATGAYNAQYNQIHDVFAPFGYTGASLDYRCGFGKDHEQNLLNSLFDIGGASCAGLTPELMAGFDTAAYRAAADCRSAIDYIFTHSDEFPYIDTNQIYILGVSAGAITILHAAFSEKDDLLPGAPLPAFAPRHKLAGVISISGALVSNFGTALQDIEASESVPLFMAQGTVDPVVAAELGPLNACSNIHPSEWWNGGIGIARKACEHNYPYQLVLMQGAGHDLAALPAAYNTMLSELGVFLKNTGMCGLPAGVEKVVNNTGAVIYTKACAVPTGNPCDSPANFLVSSTPLIIDTFLVHTDTVPHFYGYDFPVKLKIARPVYDGLNFYKRPLMIGVHGGGFVSDSIGGMASTNAYLDMYTQLRSIFAGNGMVTASLDYRTGYGILNEYAVSVALASPNSPACDALTPSVLQYFDTAVYRATYDCRMAIDYIFKNPELFPYVDTSRIFVYGVSAGAITILHAAFSEAGEMFTNGTGSLPGFAPKHQLAGGISLAGALTSDFSTALNTIEPSESIPLFLVHGTADLIVPVDSGGPGTCNNVDPEARFHGSRTIAARLCEEEMPYELFLIDGAGHDAGGGSAGFNVMVTSFLNFITKQIICDAPVPQQETMVALDGTVLYSGTCADHSTGIAETGRKNVVIYPNPSHHILNFDLEDITKTEVLDVSGRTVILAKNSINSLDISGLNTGMYFIRISALNGEYFGSFIKE
ncbi:MAG: T9SS type A sorting domain-containing protein [Bacteroidota bacterium]